MEKNNTKFIVVINKSDEKKADSTLKEHLKERAYPYIEVSAMKKEGIHELKQLIIRESPKTFEQPSIVGDLINPGEDIVFGNPCRYRYAKGKTHTPTGTDHEGYLRQRRGLPCVQGA